MKQNVLMVAVSTMETAVSIAGFSLPGHYSQSDIMIQYPTYFVVLLYNKL